MLGPEENLSEWKSWQEGLSVKITLPKTAAFEDVRGLGQPYRPLNAEFLLWMFCEGDYGALHAVGRQLVEHDRVHPAHPCRRALSESIRESPSRSSSGWKRRLEDGIGTRRRLSGVVGAPCDEHGLESGVMPWEVAEPAREGPYEGGAEEHHGEMATRESNDPLVGMVRDDAAFSRLFVVAS